MVLFNLVEHFNILSVWRHTYARQPMMKAASGFRKSAEN